MTSNNVTSFIVLQCFSERKCFEATRKVIKWIIIAKKTQTIEFGTQQSFNNQISWNALTIRTV